MDVSLKRADLVDNEGIGGTRNCVSIVTASNTIATQYKLTVATKQNLEITEIQKLMDSSADYWTAIYLNSYKLN